MAERSRAEGIAQHGEKAQFLAADGEVGGGDLDGERIGRLAVLRIEGVGDEAEHGLEALGLLEDLARLLGDRRQAGLVEMAEDRQVLDDVADLLELRRLDAALDARNGDHGVDERLLDADGARHMRLRVGVWLGERRRLVQREAGAVRSQPIATASIASTRPMRARGTPGGKAVAKREANLESRMTKLPRSWPLRISLPKACLRRRRTVMSV
jgi:hypothetical protein